MLGVQKVGTKLMSLSLFVVENTTPRSTFHNIEVDLVLLERRKKIMLLQLVLLFFLKPKLSDGKVFDPCKLFSIFEDHFEKNQINDCMYT